MLATRHRSVRVVKSLLTRNDLDPNIVNSYGDHVLHFSVFLGRAIVKSLLDHPANVNPNVVGGNGLNRTALMEACVAGELGVVQLFLETKGIEINLQDSTGRTALCLAVCRNRCEIAKLLLARDDIDPNLPDHEGRTAISGHAIQDAFP